MDLTRKVSIACTPVLLSEFRDGLEAVLSRQRQLEVEAERSRQGSNVLNRGEARQR